MGLFNVSMPLLYGEGDKAFIRLQTEIMKQTADETIFAWTAPWDDGTLGPLAETGLLARSPLAFQGSGDVRSAAWPSSREPQGKPKYYQAYRPPWGLTNNFLHIARWLVPANDFIDDSQLFHSGHDDQFWRLSSKTEILNEDDYAVATFSCLREGEPHRRMGVIIRRKLPSHGFALRYPDTYTRVRMNGLLWVDPIDFMEKYNKNRREMWEAEIHVEQLGPIRDLHVRTSQFWFKTQALTESHFLVSERRASSWKSYWETKSLHNPRLIIDGPWYGALMFADAKSSKNLVALVGWGNRSQPGVNIFVFQRNLSLKEIMRQVAETDYNELLRYDRVSKPLEDEEGRSVLIAVRKGVEEGVTRYAVDIEIDQTGALPWPNSSWPLLKS
jgi:hypothetical protein